MKTRNGFVSNSSSSSFIVRGATTAQIALLMLYQIKFERIVKWDDYDLPEGFESAIGWLHNNREFNDHLAFPWSVNEETFICNMGDRILVSTCHNHNWKIVGGVYTSEDYLYSNQHDIDVNSCDFLNLANMNQETRNKVRGYYQ